MSQKYIEVKTETISANGTKFVYRVTGEKSDVPVICFNHLAGVLDDWDPRVIDGIAQNHMVITFNNRGIGASEGTTPTTVQEMADDAIEFVKALGYSRVDFLGFSHGGCIAQVAYLKRPDL